MSVRKLHGWGARDWDRGLEAIGASSGGCSRLVPRRFGRVSGWNVDNPPCPPSRQLSDCGRIGGAFSSVTILSAAGRTGARGVPPSGVVAACTARGPGCSRVDASNDVWGRRRPRFFEDDVMGSGRLRVTKGRTSFQRRLLRPAERHPCGCTDRRVGHGHRDQALHEAPDFSGYRLRTTVDEPGPKKCPVQFAAAPGEEWRAGRAAIRPPKMKNFCARARTANPLTKERTIVVRLERWEIFRWLSRPFFAWSGSVRPKTRKRLERLTRRMETRMREVVRLQKAIGRIVANTQGQKNFR